MIGDFGDEQWNANVHSTASHTGQQSTNVQMQHIFSEQYANPETLQKKSVNW